MVKQNKKTAADLSNTYKINEVKGTVKYTVKCHGQYFTGKAKVNWESGDVFDVEKGKRLAKIRAFLKMKRAQLTDLIEVQSMIRLIASKEQKITEDVAALIDRVCRLQAKLNTELGVEEANTEAEVPMGTL